MFSRAAESLNISCRRSLSYRNQMNWFLCDRDLLHERFKGRNTSAAALRWFASATADLVYLCLFFYSYIETFLHSYSGHNNKIKRR